MTKINITPTEYEEQTKCIEYLELMKLQGHKILYTATAQSTFTSSWNQKAKNQKMGVRKGLPDLIIVIDGVLLFVELKREKGGVVSSEQKEWINTLNEAGEYAFIAKGFVDFKKFIDQTIKIQAGKLKK